MNFRVHDKSKAVRDVVCRGRILLAIEHYKKGTASLGRAAGIAGVPSATRSRCSRNTASKTTCERKTISKDWQISESYGHELHLLPLLAAVAAAQPAASRTMRVDYVHPAPLPRRHFALDGIVARRRLAGPAGPLDRRDQPRQVLFQVIDRATNRLLYSRGFASIFGEWETTDEAKHSAAPFTRACASPRPRRPVQVVLKKRDARERLSRGLVGGGRSRRTRPWTAARRPQLERLGGDAERPACATRWTCC